MSIYWIYLAELYFVFDFASAANSRRHYVFRTSVVVRLAVVRQQLTPVSHYVITTAALVVDNAASEQLTTQNGRQ